jgi:uncharacterized repeat protein (TIGR02543 family)
MNKLKQRIRSFKSILAIGAAMLCSISAWAETYIPDYDSFSESIVLSGTSYSFTVGDITWVYRNFKKGSPHSGSWNEGVVLVEARGNVEGDISIPAKTSDNRPVIALGSGLFSGNKNLDSVIIPESITMLFPSVFYGCEYLREVTIPDSVNEISGSIFAKCSRLKKVKMGANTPCVSYRMFLDCASLETIEWGGKETFIGDQAFLRCTSLKDVIIPDGVVSMGYSFQDCGNLTNIVFGAGVKSIGGSCFTGCTKLSSVTFGNSLHSIGESCFSGCVELRKVVMPDSLAVLGNYAFNDCSRITDVKIGAKVKIIGACAFLDCAKLTNIVWGANNEVVGASAFMRCSGLRELRLPNTITNIYSSAFKGCSNITNVHVGTGLKTMGAEAFADNGALCDIRFLGDKVRTIGNSCFSKCTSLACFEMPDSVREFGTYLFNGCNKLSCIKIGDSVETISEGFCMDCVSLTNIVWGAAVETIGYRAFLNCTSLYDLSIPDTVKTIDGYAFSGCTELRFVKIGTGCTSILGNAFYKCGHLLFVEASGEIEEIGGNVFGDCTNLRYFSMNNSKAPISVDAYSFPRGNGACPLFHIFVNEGSSDWKGTDEIGLPESGIWKYWPIDFISNKPENIAAPYDFGFYTPNETPGYYGGVWPAPFYLTTADKFSALNPEVKTFKEGDKIYLHYAFADRWRCETIENLTNKFTLVSGGGKYSVWKKIETEDAYTSEKQQVFDFLQNLDPGTYTLTWELNVGKSLPETDYANNTTSITFTVVGVPKYKVSFNLNGASGTAPVARTVYEGRTIGELPTVKAPAGWTFLGWYTAATGGTKITSSQIINSAQTYYAHWSKCDMGFYTPSGWSQPFYLTSTSSSSVPKTSFKVGESIYLNYAFSNLASADNMSNFVNRFKLNTGAYYDDSWNGYTLNLTQYDYGWLDSTNPRLSFLQNLPTGTYTLTCTLDVTGVLSEVSEGNNTRTITFTVVADDSEPPQPPPPPPPPPSKPELGVGDYSVAGDELVGTAPEKAASVYDGYLYLNNVVVGTIQAKVSKPKLNKKLGITTAKTSVAIQVTGEKKITLKGELDLNIGEFTVTDKKSDRELNLKLGIDGITGTFGKYEIDGARNFFDSKDKSEKSAAEEILKPYLGAYSMICDGGILSVNIAKKGKVTIKGAIDGNKVSAKAQVLIGEDVLCIPVIYSKKSVNLAFTIWLPIDGSNAEVIGLGDNAIIGKAGTLKNGAQFIIDGDIGASIETEDERTLELLPDNETITVSKSKWLVADGIKPAKVAYKKGEFTITEGKKGAGIVNPSGLKLSYKSKDGSFTGSFTAYAIVKGKLKKHKATVEGILIGDVGYGTITINKVGTWAVTIE